MASIKHEEKIPFLSSEDDHDDQKVRPRQNGFWKNRSAAAHGILLVVQLLLFVLNVVFLISNITYLRARNDTVSSNASSMRAFSPAESALEYIIVEEDNYGHHQSPYTGEPRPEVDQAWSHLLRSTNLRITKDEMIKMNKTSLTLKDGSGYVGYLEAIHMLHCVKRLYQSHNPDHYPEQQRAGAFTDDHFYHCLDVIREGIMCNADVAINTLLWDGPSKVKGARPGPRKCTDWGRLQAWADDKTLAEKDLKTFLATAVVPFDEIGSVGPTELLV
ncbi:uncharacterized protein F4822DRAFT_429914 [Hypoxylon trugodes]|uniref:uncharacterized protein n=1 Tax=Hypoxylon trugodes TaxID=326681 RepID=UPI0021A04AD4|nr:uncharacterized protein F4822DRAFT_429914 [Hypoxylon trugodes]KAI1387153.1 hypothetical protein F4822DRAFT_429914 [Hypoxylon trugodes]